MVKFNRNVARAANERDPPLENFEINFDSYMRCLRLLQKVAFRKKGDVSFCRVDKWGD
jgi:succinate dehydrogenase/fumarate reductase-like Fe-S protein